MIKHLIQNFFSLFGLRLSRLPTPAQIKQADEDEIRKTLWLRNRGIKTVLDIGSNTGQFVSFIREVLPDATIYSFEPLIDCYEELMAQFGNLPKFQAFNLALGNETGQVEIHRSDFSPSSSLLPMAELHKSAFPYTEKEAIQSVNIVKLDEIAVELNLEKPILIKLDVQGFEHQVIAGGINTISRADILIVELSLECLYQGQKLFHPLYEQIVSFGFDYRGNFSQLVNPNDGRVLQVDAIFVKDSNCN